MPNHQPSVVRHLPSVFWLLPLAWLWLVLINDLRVEWTVNPQYAYGWAVPFLCAFLVWRGARRQVGSAEGKAPGARRRRPETGTPISAAPLSVFRSQVSVFRSRLAAFSFQLFGVCLLAFLYAPTRLVEEANPGWRLISWALALETVGITLGVLRLALGPSRFQVSGLSFQLSHFVFPLCFFLVAVPWPSLIEQPLIQHLTQMDTRLTTELLGWIGIPAMPHGNVIEVATGVVGIDVACSGIRSFQATLMLSLLFGEFYRLSPGRRVGLCLLGFALSLLFNLARMSMLVWVAARNDPRAIAAWHDPAGVTILLACFIGLWVMGVVLKANTDMQKAERLNAERLKTDMLKAEMLEFEKLKTETRKGEGGNEESGERPGEIQSQRFHGPRGAGSNFRVSAFQLSAFMAALAVWIVLTEVSVAGWYRWHETRVPKAPRWTVAWPANNPTFETVPLPEKTREILRYNEGQSARWNEGDLTWQAVFLRWKPGRTAIHLAENHTPNVCLTAAGYQLESIAPQEWFDVHGLRMPFSVNEVVNAPRPFYVFYCLWDDRASVQGFQTMGLTYGNRLAPVLAGLRNPGQRSLEIAVTGPKDAAAAASALKEELGKLIVPKP